MKVRYLLLTLFLVLAYFAHQEPYFAADPFFAQQIQQLNFYGFAHMMRMLSWLGETEVAVASVVVAFVLLYSLKRKHDAWLVVMTSSSLAILGKCMKYVVARPRPNPLLVQQFSEYFKQDSFPSGHVLFFVGFYGMIFYFLQKSCKKNGVRTGFSLLCVLLMLGIGISRVFLGAHWLSDVMGAYLLGLFWVSVMVEMSHRWTSLLKQER